MKGEKKGICRVPLCFFRITVSPAHWTLTDFCCASWCYTKYRRVLRNFLFSWPPFFFSTMLYSILTFLLQRTTRSDNDSSPKLVTAFSFQFYLYRYFGSTHFFIIFLKKNLCYTLSKLCNWAALVQKHWVTLHKEKDAHPLSESHFYLAVSHLANGAPSPLDYLLNGNLALGSLGRLLLEADRCVQPCIYLHETNTDWRITACN